MFGLAVPKQALTLTPTTIAQIAIHVRTNLTPEQLVSLALLCGDPTLFSSALVPQNVHGSA